VAKTRSAFTTGQGAAGLEVSPRVRSHLQAEVATCGKKIANAMTQAPAIAMISRSRGRDPHAVPR